MQSKLTIFSSALFSDECSVEQNAKRSDKRIDRCKLGRAYQYKSRKLASAAALGVVVLLAAATSGCAVVSVASTAVSVTAGAAGLAADAAIGTAKIAGKVAGKVVDVVAD